ncbi:MAG: DinB family protein [Algibacter sp.]|uniref:DinB family protein n=1 Tax=Algibacter sp. TaxID=1872428 RepID=UPI00262C53B8|nr:DinB family protein [Algibacter sp.]MDG1729449.1 DinB family protein [Algibacter sp.]MDG2178635.1 DinB family protein [Algibacter sp.]
MKPNNTFDQLAALSSEIRRLTLKRLEEVPEGFINWRLNNTAMSFAHLVQHIIDVDNIFFSLSTTNKRTFKWEMGSEEPHFNVDETIYKSLIETLKANGEKRNIIISEFNAITIKDLVRNTKGEEMTFWWFIMHHVLEHETYHRGQIATYLKVLKGESAKI